MGTTTFDEVVTDLVAEYDRLEAILDGLTGDQWSAPSGAPGWTITDVVVHLALTEEGVATTIAAPVAEWTTRDHPLDDVLADQVRTAALSPTEAFDRWRAARRASVAALRAADPGRLVRWAAAPLKPQTLATTRLAEHWAHALDIVEPLDVGLPDTDRLRHIAWLGHATLPYALGLAGVAPFPVRATLTAPSGAVLTFGPADAAATIEGDLGAFCRVGARRLTAEDAALVTNGPDAATALRFLRNYAA